jgi:hypothetical protein
MKKKANRPRASKAKKRAARPVPRASSKQEPYFFQGVVLPERAQLKLEFAVKTFHQDNGAETVTRVSIVLNQLAVWVESDYAWEKYALRNVVEDIVRSHLAMCAYLTGLAHDVEITRVINRERGVNWVYGIDTPVLVDRNKALDVQAAMNQLHGKIAGPNGVFLRRCLGDLVSAMKNATDTAFYCYRAIESLREHSAAVNGVAAADRDQRWKKFREVAGVARDAIEPIAEAAKPVRHGGVARVTDADRVQLFTRTWDIVDAYLATVTPVTS